MANKRHKLVVIYIDEDEKKVQATVEARKDEAMQPFVSRSIGDTWVMLGDDEDMKIVPMHRVLMIDIKAVKK